jgi:hypothetical protein
VPGPGGWIEQVQTFPVPPQPRFTVVAWANRVTYSYVDRKGVSVLPDFDLKTHVSLGVFPLPPGEYLRDGETVDVFQEALYQGNPGAAAGFGPPAGGPELVPREPASPLLPPSVRRQFQPQPEATIAPTTTAPGRTEPQPVEPRAEDEFQVVPRRTNPQPQPGDDGPLIPPLPN